jgi:hypothetical protein
MIMLYDFGNVADWISALGTISAVIVALYLASRERKPRAFVSSNVGYAVYEGGISEDPIQIGFNIVNTGLIPIYISECTIQISKWSKDRLTFRDGSHSIKKLLGPGEHLEHVLDYHPIKEFYLSRKIKTVKTIGYFKDARGKKYKTKVKLYIR